MIPSTSLDVGLNVQAGKVKLVQHEVSVNAQAQISLLNGSECTALVTKFAPVVYGLHGLITDNHLLPIRASHFISFCN